MEEKMGNRLERIDLRDTFQNITSAAQTLRETIKKMGPPQTEKLLSSKRQGQQDKMAAYRIGKNLH